ncbi:MAG: hypothetical protein IT479_16195 [Xanthomonadales bacterium]|nr:hypothetical protein [Xanthomonadales bacterium]MCC6594802.1 hypothetical protein [Xanthomonadales bacterium]
MIECPACHGCFSAAALLAGCSGFQRGSGLVGGQCPLCGQAFECRVGKGRIEIGYTYWAGSLHFEALSLARVAGLELDTASTPPAALLGGVRYPLA